MPEKCPCGWPADPTLTELNGEAICKDCCESENHDLEVLEMTEA